MSVRIHRCDVVVVGARAAGAATAMLLSRLGHDVVLLDRAMFPADTISTHQIARTGVLQLLRWGVLPEVLHSGAPPIRLVSFTAAGETTTRPVKDKAGVDLLVAPRRYVLDSLLAKTARRAGTRVQFGVTVAGVCRDDDARVVGVHGTDPAGRPTRWLARYVIGADGLRSVVSRSVGASIVEDRGHAGGAQYAYFTGLTWSGIELFASDQALAGVFPTHDGQACIWVCTPSAAAGEARRRSTSRDGTFMTVLARAAPSLVHRLREGRRASEVTGMLRMPNRIRAAHGLGWALVGDAGYHRDAVTGYGISDAYRDAERLACALDRILRGIGAETAELSGYERDRDEAIREIFDITCAMVDYPPVPTFVELQKRLSTAIDVDAGRLVSRPVPGGSPTQSAPSLATPAPASITKTSICSDMYPCAESGPRDRRGDPDRRRIMTTPVDGSTRNGVDTATLFATLDAVKAAPAAAKFQFRATNTWVNGTHSRTTIHDFFGVGEDRSHEQVFHLDADHPTILVGRDSAPTPTEFVLHALAACLTAGLANIAAARGVKLTQVESTVTGNIDLNGILGLDSQVRNGYQDVAVRFRVSGDAPPEKLRALVEQSRIRSAVYDILTNGVPVTIEIDTDPTAAT